MAKKDNGYSYKLGQGQMEIILDSEVAPSVVDWPEQAPPETREVPEPTCKLCGGFLSLRKCQNWSLDLFGKESRVKASGVALPGFRLWDLDAEEPVYIDGREASRVELLEFLDSCLKHKRPCRLYGEEFRTSEETTFLPRMR